MKTSLIAASIAMTLLAGSCTSDNQAATTLNIYEEPQWPPVELNNGVKWTANVETTQSIEIMINFLQQQDAKSSAANIKAELQNEFKLIFKNCTMTGEAHDQLHNYLLPLRDKINELNEENQKTAIPELQRYLKSYYTYFQ